MGSIIGSKQQEFDDKGVLKREWISPRASRQRSMRPFGS
jgi:hypothetical protein